MNNDTGIIIILAICTIVLALIGLYDSVRISTLEEKVQSLQQSAAMIENLTSEQGYRIIQLEDDKTR